MNKRGANVVGDSTKLFGAGARVSAAEFLVGGRITRINGQICHVYGFWRGETGKSIAAFDLHIEWELFSTLTRRVVYKFSTKGYARGRRPIKDAMGKTFSTAFARAVAAIADDDGFEKTLARKSKPTISPQPSHEHLTLTGQAPFRNRINNHVGNVRAASVTIELASGHGSGFLISRDGYVLTNAHVVGEGKIVPVVFNNGVRVNGRVLRIAQKRDVALVKVPLIADYVLPIAQKKAPKVLDTVYALGTPLERSLRATLTKGIVSAYRNIGNDLHIQADVAVTGGNSGGPLLDKNGNVVGITVSKLRGGENLNLFIPIDSALKALNLNIKVE